MDITLPPDFKEFLRLLNTHGVEYLLIGGYAVGYHGYPRATNDMDIWIAIHPQNAERMVAVLRAFGFDTPALSPDLFLQDHSIVRMGVPPIRIEILTTISGVQFAACLEDALIRHLEAFLLELGNDFTFVGRQKRLRIDDEWYRVDLVFYHRRLRCLVIIDLKLDRLTHADVGQRHLYCNYARAHWTLPDENPPVGLILCTGTGAALARYALKGLPNKIMATEYLTALPPQELLEAELDRTRRILSRRDAMRSTKKTAARKKRS